MTETTTKTMREILFRGQGIDGNWYYGVPLVFTEDYVCMTAPHTYNKAVIPETVGEYTGLTDKKGKKIFEGDVCSVTKPCISTRGVITFQKGCFIFKEFNTDSVLELDRLSINQFEIEIIGDIHDNPEFKE